MNRHIAEADPGPKGGRHTLRLGVRLAGYAAGICGLLVAQYGRRIGSPTWFLAGFYLLLVMVTLFVVHYFWVIAESLQRRRPVRNHTETT